MPSMTMPVETEHAIGLLHAREMFARALAPHLAHMLVHGLCGSSPDEILPAVPRARVPSGLVSRSVAALEVGEQCVVRASHRVSFQNAARRQGKRLKSETYREGEELKCRLTRIE